MPSVDFLLKIKLLWLFICLVPRISCKHVLDPIGSTLSIFLWLQMDTAKQSLEWHDVLGLERHSITRIFRYPLLIFAPHLNLAPAHLHMQIKNSLVIIGNAKRVNCVSATSKLIPYFEINWDTIIVPIG
jgi:hypothetical protein